MAISGNRQSATVAAVPAPTTVANLLTANSTRGGFIITNGTTGNLFVKFGATATTTDYTIKLAAGAVYEAQPLGNELYGGLITGIIDTGTGNVQVTSW